MKHPPWTDEKYAEVATLIDKGWSYRNVADALHLSVGAVAGQLARRRNLPPPIPTSYNPMEQPQFNHIHRFTYCIFGNEPEFPKPPKIKPAKRLPGRTNRDTLNKMKHAPRFDVPKPRPAPDSLFLSLLDLPDNGCKYAVGADKHRHLFCGSPHVSLLPYCDFHCRIAYRNFAP